MIAPRKVKFEAKKKENENIEFRTFLRTTVCQCGIVSALMWPLVRDRLFADAVSESLFTGDQ